MAYDVSLFAKYNLFNHFFSWQDEISKRWSQSTGDQREFYESYQQQFDDFLFRAYSSLIRLERIRNQMHYAKVFFLEYKAEFTLNCEVINYWSPFLMESIIQINPFLTNLREMQNKILHLIKLEEKPERKVPISLNDAMKKIEDYGFSDQLIIILQEYWNNSGQILKKYRDLEQHYTTLVNQAYFQVKPQEKLIILLPDNPEETKSRNFTFNQKIEVLDYFHKLFRDFHLLIEKVAKYFGFKPQSKGSGKQRFNFLFRKIDKGIEKTIAVWISPDKDKIGMEIIQYKTGKIAIKTIKHRKLTLKKDFMGIPTLVEIQGFGEENLEKNKNWKPGKRHTKKGRKDNTRKRRTRRR